MANLYNTRLEESLVCKHTFSAIFRNLIVYRNFYLNRNIDHVFYLCFNHIV